eukprot:ctg_979.g333
MPQAVGEMRTSLLSIVAVACGHTVRFGTGAASADGRYRGHWRDQCGVRTAAGRAAYTVRRVGVSPPYRAIGLGCGARGDRLVDGGVVCGGRGGHRRVGAARAPATAVVVRPASRGRHWPQHHPVYVAVRAECVDGGARHLLADGPGDGVGRHRHGDHVYGHRRLAQRAAAVFAADRRCRRRRPVGGVGTDPRAALVPLCPPRLARHTVVDRTAVRHRQRGGRSTGRHAL